MSRKDFELIAATIRNYGPIADSTAKDNRRAGMARAFAKALSATNPRFDSDRFIKACGA